MVSSLHHMAVSLAPPGYQYALYAALYAASRAPWWWSCGAVQLQPESTSAPSPEFDCIPLKLSHSRLARSGAPQCMALPANPPMAPCPPKPPPPDPLQLFGVFGWFVVEMDFEQSGVQLSGRAEFFFFLAHAQAQSSKCTISFKETTANTV